MGIFDRLTATADGTSAAIAQRLAEVEAQHAKRAQEVVVLNDDTLPSAEAEVGRLLAEQELGEATDGAALETARAALRTAQEQLQGKRLANSQLEAALAVMRQRYEQARLAEIKQQRQALAETFSKAVQETEALILKAAAANRRAEDAAYAEGRLRADPLVVAAKQHGTLLDHALEQRHFSRLSQTVNALEIHHGGTLPHDPGDPGPQPVVPPIVGGSATTFMNFRER